MNDVDDPGYNCFSADSGRMTPEERTIARLERELEVFRSSGIVEVAVRNASVAEYMSHWEGRTAAAESALAALREDKHVAYSERNRLVAFLSKLYPSHIATHPADDATWDPEWRTIVCIHSPAGQLTWHLKTGEAQEHFQHLGTAAGENHWDGHTTPEKYARLASIEPADALATLRAGVEAEAQRLSQPGYWGIAHRLRALLGGGR